MGRAQLALKRKSKVKDNGRWKEEATSRFIYESISFNVVRNFHASSRKRAGESKKLDLVDSTLWRPFRLNDLREFRFNIIRSLNSVESAIYFSRYFHQNPRRISKNAMRFFFFFYKRLWFFQKLVETNEESCLTHWNTTRMQNDEKMVWRTRMNREKNELKI